MAKFSFKLLSGGHFEPNRKETPEGEEPQPGKTYKPGDVIHSDRPLDELFKNKFERLAAPAAAKKGKAGGRTK